VIVATPPKCGTTLVLQIIESLRSNGCTDFEELNMEIPCLEMAWDSGLGHLLEDGASQSYLPRVFKTHSWYLYCPGVNNPGVKHVFVMRDPKKAAVSFYHFLGGWFFDKNDIDIDTFIQEFVLKRGAPDSVMQNASIWDNIASWYPHRRDAGILFLTYEYIVKHKETSIRKIAEFIGIDGPVSKELLDVTVEQSSLEWMASHPTKYDEHHLKNARNLVCGLKATAGLDSHSTGKVRHATDRGKQQDVISDRTHELLDHKWMETVYPVTGCKSYEDLCAKLYDELYGHW
jgi:hypothetical protein